VTVAKRRLIDHWRSQAAQHRRFDRLVEQARQAIPTDTPEQTRVDEALSSLSERHRAALVLRYIEDMSVSEVADALGLTYRGAESLLGRARTAFARSFEGLS
jgi:RNA polymerase sigma-70 factor (ECF subfamily)